MRNAIAILIVLFGLAPTAESAELFLFTPSYLKAENVDWGPEVLRAEPIVFNFEAIRPRRQAPFRVQPLAAPASNFTFPIDGIENALVVDRIEEHGEGNFSRFGKVNGSDWQSHYNVTGRTVVGELWTPQGHRSLRTIGDTTYLVDWDEAEIARLIANERVVNSVATAAKHGRRRAVRHPAAPPRPCKPEEVETTNLLVVHNDQALARLGEGTQALEAMRSIAYNLGDGWNAAVINTTGALMDRVNIVGVAHVDYVDGSAKGGTFEEQVENMSKDWEWLRNSLAVKSLMKASKADAVAFFVGMYTQVGGVAGLGTGYVVVSSFHVFVSMHELGHAFISAGHDPDHWTVPSGLPAWALDRAVDWVARGFMAYADSTNCPNGCPWQPLLAMSGVFYPDTQVESGLRDKQENGRLLSYMRSTVAFATVSGNECVAETGFVPP